MRMERWIFNKHEVILFLLWCSKAALAIWSERLAKGSYQKNTPRVVKLNKPVIHRLQIQAFYQATLYIKLWVSLFY